MRTMKKELLEQLASDVNQYGPDWFDRWADRLGEVIEAWCRLHGYTKKRLAKKIGINVATLYRYISGHTLPPDDKKMRLGELLARSESSWEDNLSGQAPALVATFPKETRDAIHSAYSNGPLELLQSEGREADNKLSAFIEFLKEVAPAEIREDVGGQQRPLAVETTEVIAGLIGYSAAYLKYSVRAEPTIKWRIRFNRLLIELGVQLSLLESEFPEEKARQLWFRAVTIAFTGGYALAMEEQYKALSKDYKEAMARQSSYRDPRNLSYYDPPLPNSNWPFGCPPDVDGPLLNPNYVNSKDLDPIREELKGMASDPKNIKREEIESIVERLGHVVKKR